MDPNNSSTSPQKYVDAEYDLLDDGFNHLLSTPETRWVDTEIGEIVQQTIISTPVKANPVLALKPAHTTINWLKVRRLTFSDWNWRNEWVV